jgi:hypothetical protein
MPSVLPLFPMPDIFKMGLGLAERISTLRFMQILME